MRRIAIGLGQSDLASDRQLGCFSPDPRNQPVGCAVHGDLAENGFRPASFEQRAGRAGGEAEQTSVSGQLDGFHSDMIDRAKQTWRNPTIATLRASAGKQPPAEERIKEWRSVAKAMLVGQLELKRENGI